MKTTEDALFRQQNAQMTHKEIAARMGVSKSYVHYLEQSALKKLRRRLAHLFEEDES